MAARRLSSGRLLSCLEQQFRPVGRIASMRSSEGGPGQSSRLTNAGGIFLENAHTSRSGPSNARAKLGIRAQHARSQAALSAASHTAVVERIQDWRGPLDPTRIRKWAGKARPSASQPWARGRHGGKDRQGHRQPLAPLDLTAHRGRVLQVVVGSVAPVAIGPGVTSASAPAARRGEPRSARLATMVADC